MTKYELSLSPDYVPHWNLQDALRELFQNAIDQETTNPENVSSFLYDGETLRICNKMSNLSARTLLLGASTKADDKATIGKFGEGYKIAALVLTRLGKRFSIETHNEVWTFRFSKSKKYQSTILVCEVITGTRWHTPFGRKANNPDLSMIVDGITPEEFEELGRMNLHVVPSEDEQVIVSEKGSVLLDPVHAGKVFVNGLSVIDTNVNGAGVAAPYHLGYNFKPEFLKLDRDRKLVSDWDLKWLASSIWAGASVPAASYSTPSMSVIEETFLKLVAAKAPDVGSLQYVLGADKSATIRVAETFFDTFTATHGENSVPVTDQAEAQEATECGLKPIFV